MQSIIYLNTIFVEDIMKKITTALLILLASTSFAMSENDSVSCSKMNQDSAYQEVAASSTVASPANTPATSIKK